MQDIGTVYDVDFKNKKLNYSYSHSYKEEEAMKKELCEKLCRCADLFKALYSDDRQFLDYLGRQFKSMTYKLKES